MNRDSVVEWGKCLAIAVGIIGGLVGVFVGITLCFFYSPGLLVFLFVLGFVAVIAAVIKDERGRG